MAADAVLLTTKFSIPPARAELVPRPRLIERLMAGLAGLLTLISAPAGSGKTTLLSEWRAGPGRDSPLAWLSLDAADNDPARFLLYLVAALKTVKPELAGDAALLLQGSQLPPLETILAALIQNLSTFTAELVLVLDDYHVVADVRIHEALEFFLFHLPPCVHLVILSRSDPPLPLSRMRVRNQLVEIRAEHLRFTPGEIAAFLQGMGILRLSESQLTALEASTEGWIAGLQLAALSLQGRDDLGAFISTFTGSHHYIVDYLANEVLNRQPEAVRLFLMQTSILERMTGSLCNAVTQHADGQEQLEFLERANLFLIPLDDERHWYRYHHLFSDVLHSHLEHSQPDHVPELHRRAADWFETNGFVEEAVRHALAAHDVERAARLIEQVGLPLAVSGRSQFVLGWLDALPETVVRAHPKLCLLHASVLLFANQLEEAETRAQDAGRVIPVDGSANSRALLGLATVVDSALNLARGDLARGTECAREALVLLPETNAFERASAAGQFARAYQVSGDVTAATEKLVTELAEHAQASGSLIGLVSCFTNLGRLQALQGRLREAAATYARLLQALPGMAILLNLFHGAAYYFGLGAVYLEWNDLEAADEYVGQGLELMKGTLLAYADVVTLGYLAAARLCSARHDTNGALTVLDEYEHLAHQRHFFSQMTKDAAAARARVWLADGNLVLASHWAETSALHAEDVDLPYPSEYSYLTLARVLIAQARADQALGLLDRLLRSAEAGGRMSSVVEILALRGLAFQAQGNIPEALASLERALALAEPEGYARIFLDECAPMATLLRRAAAQGIAPRYAARLVAEFGATTSASAKIPQPLIEPLSERELQVLRLLAVGQSNRDIAKELVLAPGTVKAHLSNIFGKLNVQNRMQCVARARELNLL